MGEGEIETHKKKNSGAPPAAALVHWGVGTADDAGFFPPQAEKPEDAAPQIRRRSACTFRRVVELLYVQQFHHRGGVFRAVGLFRGL